MRQDAHEIEVAAPLVLAGYTSYLLRRAFTQLSRANASGAQPRDYVLLGVLAEDNACSQQDLAERLGINRTIMVKLIDRLEGADYVTRRRNPEDRRSYGLSVTDAGRKAMRDMEPAVAQSEQRFASALRAGEQQRLNSLLRKLVPHLSDAPSHRTGYLINQAHHAQRRRQDDAMAAVGVQTRHFSALAVLSTAGPCSQQQLAHQLGITEPAVVLIVNELVAANLVHRGRDQHDRRRYSLGLTTAGSDRFATARPAYEAVQAEVDATLGEGGAAELRRLLTKLLR
ncbi:MAG TPA: MarR family transcriptional regulator [Pseudonocardiaceae bacterium]